MAQDRKAEIRFFNEIEHACAPNGRWHRFSEQAFHKLFAELPALRKRGRRLILDAGCGNGIFGAHLAKSGFDVIGVDISLASLDFGKKLAHASGLSINFLRCDIEHLPFKERTFDVCVCGAVLHHFPVPDKVIQELSSVIKNRGKLIAFEPNGLNPFARILNDFRSPLKSRNITSNERAHTPDELKRVLQDYEFEKFMVRTIDSLYAPPLSGDRGKLGRRLISYTFFYLLFPTLGKFLPRVHQGFYVIISAERGF